MRPKDSQPRESTKMGAVPVDEDMWWCVLAFDPIVLSHPGVYFVTTNNIYTGAKRGLGLEALKVLFADRVHQYAGLYAARDDRTPDEFTTCVQAEVLYPGALSTEYLKRVYFPTAEHAAMGRSQCEVVGHPDVPMVVTPDLGAALGE